MPGPKGRVGVAVDAHFFQAGVVTARFPAKETGAGRQAEPCPDPGRVLVSLPRSWVFLMEVEDLLFGGFLRLAYPNQEWKTEL